MVRIILGGFLEHVAPSVGDASSVDVINGSHEAFLRLRGIMLRDVLSALRRATSVPKILLEGRSAWRTTARLGAAPDDPISELKFGPRPQKLRLLTGLNSP